MLRFPALFALAFSLFFSAAASAEPVSFKKDVAPVLLNNCLACHGPKKAEGGYRIDTFERVMKAGDSEAAPFTAKDVDLSEVFRRITSEDENERMPLEGDPLPAEQVAKIKQWIEEGASYDGGDATVALATIIPPPEHPAAPESYIRPMPITAVAFKPDGQEVYVGGYHELTVWNPNDGQLIRRIGGIGQRVYQISFSPDGQRIAVAAGAPGRFGEVRILKADGSLERVIGMTSDVVFDAQFSPDGSRLATAAADGVLRIFDTNSGQEQLTITSHSDWVMAVAWSDNGEKLASASRDKTAKVYDAKTGDLVVTSSQHNAAVKGVAWHPGGSEVFSSGSDNRLRRFQLAEAKQVGESGMGGEVYKLVVEGEHLFLPSADKTVRQFNRTNHQQVRQFNNGLTDAALAVDYHAGTNRVVAGSFDGRVVVWNGADGNVVASFLAAPGYQPPQ